MVKLKFVLGVVALSALAACGEPEPFSAAMDPVVLVDGSRQQTAVAQVDNGCLEGSVTQVVTYHQPRHSHNLKPVATGTVATKGACYALAALAGAAAVASVGGDTSVSAVANSASVSNANAAVGGSKNY